MSTGARGLLATCALLVVSGNLILFMMKKVGRNQMWLQRFERRMAREEESSGVSTLGFFTWTICLCKAPSCIACLIFLAMFLDTLQFSAAALYSVEVLVQLGLFWLHTIGHFDRE